MTIGVTKGSNPICTSRSLLYCSENLNYESIQEIETVHESGLATTRREEFLGEQSV
jgi:hypothetical protein